MTQDDYVVMKKTSREKLIKELKEVKKENRQLKENYDRIYNENCKLREEHNITDISLLDENYKLKKQKSDVVEYIKSLRIYGLRSGKMLITKILNKILRMLGEIDG